jgi:hypothetical protein
MKRHVLTSANENLGHELQNSRAASGAFVFAPCVARLEHGDPNEGGELVLHPIPDPLREDLAGRILEAFDLVQVVVIEALVERLPGVVDDAEVDEPPGLWIDRPRDGELDFEGMPMKALALVPRRHIGESVGGLKAEFVDESDLQAFDTLCVFPMVVKLMRKDSGWLGRRILALKTKNPVKSQKLFKEMTPRARLLVLLRHIAAARTMDCS